MVTIARFSRNIRKRSSQIQNAGARVTKMTAKRALRLLVENTPVDKGVARSNWRVGLGNTTRAVIPAYAPGKNLGRGERANASAAIAAGNARINSVKAGSNGLTIAIYITNAVPYIEKINSKTRQNSPGWIQASLAQAKAEVLPGFKVFTMGGGDGE
jgi:hypothetical protein